MFLLIWLSPDRYLTAMFTIFFIPSNKDTKNSRTASESGEGDGISVSTVKESVLKRINSNVML